MASLDVARLSLGHVNAVQLGRRRVPSLERFVGPAELVAAPLVKWRTSHSDYVQVAHPKLKVSGGQGAPDVKRRHVNHWPSKIDEGPHDRHQRETLIHSTQNAPFLVT